MSFDCYVILFTTFVVAATLIATFATPLVLTTNHYVCTYFPLRSGSYIYFDSVVQNMPTVTGRTLCAVLVRHAQEMHISAVMFLESLFEQIQSASRTYLNFFINFMSHYTSSQYRNY